MPENIMVKSGKKRDSRSMQSRAEDDGQLVRLTKAVVEECCDLGRDLEETSPLGTYRINLGALFRHVQRTTTGQRLWLGRLPTGYNGPQLGKDLRSQFMGIGPSHIKPGHLIYILAGGTHPVALKPHQSSGPPDPQTFGFLGEVYVANDVATMKRDPEENFNSRAMGGLVAQSVEDPGPSTNYYPVAVGDQVWRWIDIA
ncbi:uncharacterized protein AB675_10219 [Cyphellophora attinorum]|uniref:Uncharacterized protein n=1 Tax=Cyphellophora attinorum TaxID=1664694 RepID=A0A0N1NXZ4_9EURO|nr:uncharacterized protein AB675_10219 [Phialophora attinorum]KPI34796.1 hypothetical protein AB675_10219 [Phialophora attinorum]